MEAILSQAFDAGVLWGVAWGLHRHDVPVPFAACWALVAVRVWGIY